MLSKWFPGFPQVVNFKKKKKRKESFTIDLETDNRLRAEKNCGGS